MQNPSHDHLKKCLLRIMSFLKYFWKILWTNNITLIKIETLTHNKHTAKKSATIWKWRWTRSFMTMGEGQTLLNLNENICKLFPWLCKVLQQLIATNVLLAGKTFLLHNTFKQAWARVTWFSKLELLASKILTLP